MPIYTFRCKTDGEHDIFFKTYNTKKVMPCPVCHEPAKRIISLPGLIDVKRGWNEQANDARRDPYTQAKAQWDGVQRGNAMFGRKIEKPNEKALQLAAREIDKKNKAEKAMPSASSL